MSNEQYPYLCGGILLNLLIEAKKPSISSREKIEGKKSQVSDSDILKGLINLVTGEEVISTDATLKKDTSRYKRCEINNSSIITFPEPSTIEIFKNRFSNNCWQLIDETSEFIDTYLSEAKLEWLTKAILEIIINDELIQDNIPFQLTQFDRIYKKDIAIVESVEIEVFFISVLIYLILHRQNNSLGKYTFEKFYKQDFSKGPWKLKCPLGQTITHTINIKRFEKVDSYNINNTSSVENKLSSSIVKTTYQPTHYKVSESTVNYENVDYDYFYKTYLYNLIVGGIEKATFKNENNTYGFFIMKKERILNLWCDDLVKPLAKLGTKERDILTSFPTIFAMDQGPNGHKNGDLAHYGFVRKINVLGDNVKIVFEIISSFSQHELYKNNFEFGIEDFELYNTHWSVKEIDLEDELNHSDIEFF